MHDDHVWLLNARFNLVSASSKCGGEGLSFFRGLWRPCRAKTLPPLVGLDTRNSLISKRFSRPFSCSINFLKSIFEDFSPNTNTHFNPLPPPFPPPRSSVKQSSKISHIQSPWLVRVLGAPITHYPLLSWMNLYIAHLKKKIYVKCGHPQDIWCIVISSDGCLMRGYKRGTNKKRHGKVRCTLRAEEFFNKQCFTFFGWFGSMLRGRGSAANWMES